MEAFAKGFRLYVVGILEQTKYDDRDSRGHQSHLYTYNVLAPGHVQFSEPHHHRCLDASTRSQQRVPETETPFGSLASSKTQDLDKITCQKS